VPNQVSKRYIVEGHVQGVFFRASTQEAAQALGVTGWVRNLPDGSVEVFATGTDESLTELQQWLFQGPPNARVANVTVKEAKYEEFERFYVKRV
jgi:acylphosphatase